jgi:hypothetical protein
VVAVASVAIEDRRFSTRRVDYEGIAAQPG